MHQISDKEEEITGEGMPPIGHLYFSADEVHLFDKFAINNSMLILDFEKGSKTMEIDGVGSLSNNGVINSNSIMDLNISGDISIKSDSDTLLLENLMFEDNSSINLTLKEGTVLVFNSVSLGNNCKVNINGNLDQLWITGSVMSSGSEISAPDCDDGTHLACIGCLFGSEDAHTLVRVGDDCFLDGNFDFEVTIDKEEEGAGDGGDGGDWGIPLLSLAAAGVLGIFKSQKSKVSKARRYTKQVKKDEVCLER